YQEDEKKSGYHQNSQEAIVQDKLRDETPDAVCLKPGRIMFNRVFIRLKKYSLFISSEIISSMLFSGSNIVGNTLQFFKIKNLFFKDYDCCLFF
ncbi:MAG TPA: hypothetical protein VNE41_00820, partial [Chitinophagaceae bacterium]|nr:hypothetical protein [Chitinophagaceae bacterium]